MYTTTKLTSPHLPAKPLSSAEPSAPSWQNSNLTFEVVPEII